jgi:deoxyribonuclease V
MDMMINRDDAANTPGEMHPWDVSPQQAVDIQVELSSRVIREDSFGKISTVAGVDVGFNDETEFACAAIAVLSFPELQFITSATILNRVDFPYIPGLLSFREIPAILKALGQMDLKPDLIICDGHGTAHPRRFGLACHLGVLIGTPCIGVAKSILIGTYQAPGTKKGDWTPILDGEDTIGAVLRSRANVKPIYVSIGHRISLETAILTILQCTTKYRLPEPIRMAHRLASVQ